MKTPDEDFDLFKLFLRSLAFAATLEMNALDFLLDFATLMGTSSALTIPPGSRNAPNIPTQEVQTSKALSLQSAQKPFPHGDHLQQAPQPFHPQLGTGIPSMTSHEETIAAFSRAHASPTIQNPIDWIPAPPYPQHPSTQGQILHHPEDHWFTEVLSFDCELTCGHHPDQQYHCRYMPPPSVCTADGCAPPPPWKANQVLLQHQQPFQHIPAEGLSCEYNCEDCFYRQPCHFPYFPPHSNCTQDGCVPVAPVEMWGHVQDNLEMFTHRGNQGRVVRGNLLQHH
ncbi:hypothetical protein BU25DRAFT_455434 [Macroventuria anomochaeta]|uniref:Uncharacterized protein n=1 Tax=Macroventuria anomochaeta TaxID=301207 RepID=A0ACB6SAF0_9PLEO|nr:uncharacterized protein BU25DRAFT_455434 [Macroventuria anomochaeta]KAF2631106.1 hypothetical protein BU25DRAFT_455434 [Macroventuria anomochaeta]